jgi:CheY-like chemotaxis protein
MAKRASPVTILMADDDHDDCLLAREALQEARVVSELRVVQDGEELLQYLRREGAYAVPGAAPRPGLILLDLDMPRKDGREALEEIKADPALRAIPVIVMTTSQAENDIVQSYGLGAASYITKPVAFDSLVEVMQMLGRYWLEIVELPGGE